MQRDELERNLADSLAQTERLEVKQHQLRELMEEIHPHIPGVINRLRERLSLS